MKLNRQATFQKHGFADSLELARAVAACGLRPHLQEYEAEDLDPRLQSLFEILDDSKDYEAAASIFAENHPHLPPELTPSSELLDLVATAGLPIGDIAALLAAADVSGSQADYPPSDVARFLVACDRRARGQGFAEIATALGGSAPAVEATALPKDAALSETRGQLAEAAAATGTEFGESIPEIFVRSALKASNSPTARARAAKLIAEFEAALLGKGDALDVSASIPLPSPPSNALPPESSNI